MPVEDDDDNDNDTEPQPSSLSGSVVSAAAPSVAPRKRTWRERIWRAVAVVVVLGTIAFGIMGCVRESSFDVPIPGSSIRPGFHENAWFHRWTCPQAHDHWSAPYWSGTTVLVAISVAIGRRAFIVRAP